MFPKSKGPWKILLAKSKIQKKNTTTAYRLYVGDLSPVFYIQS